MSNLKVFTLAANGKTVREVTLASIKSVPEGEIHPHDFNHLERGRDVLFKSNELKVVVIAPKGQRGLRTRAL